MKRITVLTVYKDETGKQIAVKTRNEDTGEIKELVLLSVFLEMQKDIIPVNFTVINNKYIRGKGCKLTFIEMISKEAIFRRYKMQVVCLKPYIREGGRPFSEVIYGVPVWHGDVSEYTEERMKRPTNDYAWVPTGKLS